MGSLGSHRARARNRSVGSVVRALDMRGAIVCGLVFLVACGAAVPSSTTPAWNEWSASPFESARRDGKVVLLSVQAGWCHWCHVMNATTFRDPEVRRMLRDRFVLVRADADARPDLAQRYRAYGWPATVFLAPDGRQILALRGYRSPERFRAILRDVVEAAREGRVLSDDAGASEAPASDLDALRTELIARLDAFYDPELSGWGHRQRYPLAAPVEHALFRAAVRGESEWRERALSSLERYATLIDPVWGGMYQYSEGGVWDRPHFEKIVPVQAGAMRVFADAYRATGDRRWLDRAEQIHRYVRAQLTAPDGAFYASQDADLSEPHVPGTEYYAHDDAGRRALGIPNVDRHVYAAENGMMIAALARLAIASGDSAPLEEAERAAERLLATHATREGLYVHDADASDPRLYLADQAHVLAALIALHEASGDARWRERAVELAHALDALRDPESGGYAASTDDPAAVFHDRLVPIEENAVAARALLTLGRLVDEPSFIEAARASLRACARRGELRSMGRMIGDYVVALEIEHTTYVRLYVVGPDAPETRALHRAAIALAEPTRIVELARPDESHYPYPGEPSIFLCTADSCSTPVTDPSALPGAVREFLER